MLNVANQLEGEIARGRRRERGRNKVKHSREGMDERFGGGGGEKEVEEEDDGVSSRVVYLKLPPCGCLHPIFAHIAVRRHDCL